jgi:DNA-binding Lrp family transcriptional regulator
MQPGPANSFIVLPLRESTPHTERMSAADFLLSPEVQKLLKVAYAGADSQFPVRALAKATRLDEDEVQRTLDHLVTSGILTRYKAQGDEPEAFGVNSQFIFHAELRSIALKSFAGAEPLRAMLRSRFKDSVLRAFVLGEDDAGTIEVLVVHGQKAPEQSAMSEAIHKLSKATRRNFAVHVISHTRYGALNARDSLHARLADGSAFEIIKPGDSKAQAPMERTGFLHSARKKLAALAG